MRISDWSSDVYSSDLDIVLAVGERMGHLGQSMWLREIHGREEGPPPPVDLKAERRTGDFIRGAISAGWITACHAVSEDRKSTSLNSSHSCTLSIPSSA